VEEALLGLKKARNRSSSRPGARTPWRDAVRRGGELCGAGTGSGAFKGTRERSTGAGAARAGTYHGQYGGGQGRTYDGAAFDGLGARVAWGRSEPRWEGARGPREARGRLGYRGGRCWRAAGAGAVGARGSALSPEFTQSAPV
jgi:hypothetical protein